MMHVRRGTDLHTQVPAASSQRTPQPIESNNQPPGSRWDHESSARLDSTCGARGRDGNF